jgi:hypothetical protein
MLLRSLPACGMVVKRVGYTGKLWKESQGSLTMVVSHIVCVACLCTLLLPVCLPGMLSDVPWSAHQDGQGLV